MSRTLDHSSFIYSSEIDSILNVADSEFDSAISEVSTINSIFDDIFEDLNNDLDIDLNDINNILLSNTNALNHVKNVLNELNNAFYPNLLEIHSIVSKIDDDTLKFHYIDSSDQGHFIAYIEIAAKSGSVLNYKEFGQAAAASVYPNPTNNSQVMLKVNSAANSLDNGVFNLNILNSASKIISTSSVREGYNILDVEKLTPGLYFIYISSSNDSFVLKFIKN